MPRIQLTQEQIDKLVELVEDEKVVLGDEMDDLIRTIGENTRARRANITAELSRLNQIIYSLRHPQQNAAPAAPAAVELNPPQQNAANENNPNPIFQDPDPNPNNNGQQRRNRRRNRRKTRKSRR